MKSGKNRIWAIGLSILFLGILVTGYWYFFQRDTVPAGVEPKTEVPSLEDTPAASADDSEIVLADLEIGVVDMATLTIKHPKYKTVLQLEEQIQSYQKELAQKADQLQLAQDQVNNQNSELNNQLNSQLATIREKYQKKIDDKTAELQAELTAYEEEIWNNTMNDIERKKEDLQKLAQSMVANLREKQIEDLALFQEEINQEYYQEVLNLRLKLQLVQLTEEEHQKYQEKLNKIELEKKQRLDAEQSRLEEELEAEIAEIQTNLEKDLQQYQEDAYAEVERQLETKKTELDKQMEKYIADMETAMHNEFQERQTKLEEQAKDSLLKTREEIESDITQREKSLQENIREAQEEKKKTLAEIDTDLREMIAKLAQKRDLDLVLTEIRVNVRAVDLTQEVLERLSQ